MSTAIDPIAAEMIFRAKELLNFPPLAAVFKFLPLFSVAES